VQLVNMMLVLVAVAVHPNVMTAHMIGLLTDLNAVIQQQLNLV
jgi:type III secretory pathway component EscS